jgi:hypothetical protein
MAPDRLPQGWNRRLRSLPATVADKVMRLGPVARALEADYRERVETHRAHLPPLHGLDVQIRAGLVRDGIFATSLEALGIDDSADMLVTARQLADNYRATARRRAARGDTFLMVPPTDIAAHPRLFRWGLEDRLLDVAEAYLGLPAAYDGLAILHTPPSSAEESTRRWHRDREDRRMMKIAIYLNDVDGDGGPFELDTRGRAADRTDDPAAIRSCEGPAGTVVFADTARCLHRGRPARRERAAIFYSYFARRPDRPYFCERSGLSRAQIADLTRGLPPRQVESALWHDALPSLLRIIPSAPI